MRARAKHLDLSDCEPWSMGIHVYNEVGGHDFLPYDTSSPLPEETSYLSKSFSTRDHDLQRNIQLLSNDGLLALHQCLSQELENENPSDDNASNNEHIFGGEGLGPQNQLYGSEDIQDVARTRLWSLSTSPLIASESFHVILIYLDNKGDSVLKKSVWPMWTDFDCFIQTMSKFHSKVTDTMGSNVENIKRKYVQLIDDFIISKPAPPKAAAARTYQTWFNNLDIMNDAWAYLWQRKFIKQLPEILQLIGRPLPEPSETELTANSKPALVGGPYDFDSLLEASTDENMEEDDWPQPGEFD
ncbi:hypothetical protein CORC01_11925 [Colletotrichum orchidophilum]|uniref:Uncharacterized protein n=1 Tax=Colletotrichum orchidophilum TaxID=1209926 RepID=A0A1G4AUJ1_9PEZI|nr:uncharacterized protein CORC01_11925 [Colletotrichum orchidophilum]OHE92775.1 hypothetical protein CORC01_11925 [Colletotrichum orchidophilum]